MVVFGGEYRENDESMKTALVITTYDSPGELGICLKSVELQSTTDLDIYIADDGSSSETRVKIESFRTVFGKRLHHIWHEDRGYRKAKINNKVFKRLNDYDLVICVDGDTFLHKRFVSDHQFVHSSYPGRDVLFMGRRVDLGPIISEKVFEGNVSKFIPSMNIRLLISSLTRDTTRALRSISMRNRFIRHLFNRDEVHDLQGSNFSITRTLLFATNGYDENFESYWGEDGDLFIRARNSGARVIGSKSVAIQYHIHHSRREPTEEKVAGYSESLKDLDYKRCEKGIFQN